MEKARLANPLPTSQNQNPVSTKRLLRVIIEQGDGLPKDYQQAIEWYTKAIALYHPSAETRKKHCEQVLRDQEQRMDKYQREIPSQIPQFPTTKYIFFDTECNGLPKYYNVDVCITSNWAARQAYR